MKRRSFLTLFVGAPLAAIVPAVAKAGVEPELIVDGVVNPDAICISSATTLSPYAVVADKIGGCRVSASQIAANAITMKKLAVGSITAKRISV